jgi:hypothetical protein
MLLPLPEASLLGFDLLGEPPAKLFLFFLELGVIELLHLALAVLARLHLLLAVVFVVMFLSGRNEVEHERADEQRAQFAEVTMILIFDCTVASIPQVVNRELEIKHLLRHPRGTPGPSRRDHRESGRLRWSQ